MFEEVEDNTSRMGGPNFANFKRATMMYKFDKTGNKSRGRPSFIEKKSQIRGKSPEMN